MNSDAPLATALRAGVDALGIGPLEPAIGDVLIAYLLELEKWNRVYNLTAVRGLENMLVQHILDSLSTLPYLPGKRLLDVGSGAGLPGIPLALVARGLEVTLIDSNLKKTSFLDHVVAQFRIHNVTVVRARADEYIPAAPFDVVISRAFGELTEFAELAKPLLTPDGRIAAMKGVYPYEELEKLAPGFTVDRVLSLSVPGLTAQRHLVLLRNT